MWDYSKFGYSKPPYLNLLTYDVKFCSLLCWVGEVEMDLYHWQPFSVPKTLPEGVYDTCSNINISYYAS